MKIRLNEIDTRAPKDLEKKETKEKTIAIHEELNELQNLLYAENKHSVLIILQGMDASGKDGAIRNVFSGMNPQGLSVRSFKVPTEDELAHDFLWRIHKNVPGKGMIHIFNRSHYEDILVTRVHKLIDDDTAKLRMKAINQFEDLLERHNNTHVLKFYLHISKEEQAERLAERMKDPAKMWKYNARDFEESKLWDKYQAVYEECFETCNEVRWTIVPADQNWYKEYIIATELLKLLKGLGMQYPTIDKS
jgi:PPK2 family polyphosphate:nucleotide phosphotransferase